MGCHLLPGRFRCDTDDPSGATPSRWRTPRSTPSCPRHKGKGERDRDADEEPRRGEHRGVRQVAADRSEQGSCVHGDQEGTRDREPVDRLLQSRGQAKRTVRAISLYRDESERMEEAIGDGLAAVFVAAVVYEGAGRDSGRRDSGLLVARTTSFLRVGELIEVCELSASALLSCLVWC
jgi:hypothetical protein